jgi:GNAT superfamily N-acetyltransferase
VTFAPEIGRATSADRDVVVEFHRRLYIEHRDSIVSPALSAMLAHHDFEEVLCHDAEAILRNPEGIVFLARDAEGELGYISGHFEVDRRRVLTTKGVVEDWFVVPKARRHGVGRLLLSALTDFFVSHGCQVLESRTWAFNPEARRAHEKLGFDEIEVVYRKRLDA